MQHKLVTVLLLAAAICQIAAAQGVITTFAGTDNLFNGDGEPALSVAFNLLHGITIDPNGNPVVVDSYDSVVVRLNSDGKLTVLAGNGYHGNSGDGGSATSAGVDIPYGAAFDRQGNLYILQETDIRKVSPNGTISTIAGSGLGFFGDGGPAVNARMSSVGGIAIDAAGNIYFADSDNNRVRKIDTNGIITTVAGNGASAFGGDNGPATAASLNSPRGVAVDGSGNLYIADTFNYRIRKVTSNGVITTLFYGGALGPYSLAVDGNGVLYIGWYDNVYKLPPGATTPQLIAGKQGTPGFSGDGGPAGNALLNGFNGQIDVAADNNGNLFIADEQNYRVRKIAPNGVISTVAGVGPFPADNMPKLGVPLRFPLGVAFDPVGNFYVADPANNRVLKISPGGTVTTFAGTGAAGATGDGGPARLATLNYPEGLALYGGNLYIADLSNSRVRQVTPGGIITTYAVVPSPTALAFDQTGNLYVTCIDSLVRRIDIRGGVTVFAGTGVYGYSGDGGPAVNATLREPLDIAVDSAGNVYIADYTDSRVRVVTPEGIIRTYAGTGVSGNSGDNGPATLARLGQPRGLALDTSGNLYIADQGYGVVRRVTPSGLITTVAGGGPEDLVGDGKPATQATLNPAALVFDSSGNLYISDWLNNRIREVLATPPTMTVAPASLLTSAASGGAPVSQTVSVIGSVAGLDFTVAVSPSGKGWLTVDTSSDSTPRLLTVTADPGALAQGSYSATLTIIPTAAIPAALTVTVAFQVGAAQPALLAIDRTNLSFIIPQGVGARTSTLLISNQGGQVLNYNASFSTSTGGNWLAISPASGQASPGKPSTVTVTANPAGLGPGTYTAQVSIQGARGGPTVIPVIMTISANKQAILLTQSGLSFTAVAQGGVIPPQYFGVINVGTGVMNWTATTSTTKGTNWLQVSPASGSSNAALPAPQVTVRVNANGLAAGAYYGTVFVDAPGTANLSRLMTVFLKVLPPGTAYAASVQPPELVFTATPGGGTPGSQIVDVYNITAAPRSFTSGRSSGSFQLYSLPRDGTLDPNQPTHVVVQPAGYVAAGSSLNGALTFQFSDGTVQPVKITIVSAASQSPQGSSVPGARGASSGCQPGSLTVKNNTLSPAFQVEAGWKVGLNLSVTDDCTNPLTGAAGEKVWVSFSDGEDNVDLIPLGDGTWQQSWKPAKSNQGITITAHARRASLSGQNVISGGLGSTNDQPQFSLSSVLTVFDRVPAIRPLAPGSFISIFGSNLAGSIALTSAPSAQLADTQVFFGRTPAPIAYVSPTQINVIVPWGSTPSLLSQQVRIQSGDKLSDPVSVDLAAAQPAVLQTVPPNGNAYVYALDSPADGSPPFVVTPVSPARANDVLQMYGVGLGLTDQPIGNGGISPSSPLAIVSVTVNIGGQNATVIFSGLAPGFVGLYQINAVMPSGVTPGDAVQLTVTVGGQTSPAATLAAR